MLLLAFCSLGPKWSTKRQVLGGTARSRELYEVRSRDRCNVAAGGSQESAQAPMPNPAIVISPAGLVDKDRETALIQACSAPYLCLIVPVILGKMKQSAPKSTKADASRP